MSDRLALATRTARARRASSCPACRRAIRPGHELARLTGPTEWVHAACVPLIRTKED